MSKARSTKPTSIKALRAEQAKIKRRLERIEAALKPVKHPVPPGGM